MDRAAVLIGVRKTGGGLPELQAVLSGVAAVETWAKGQPGMKSVATITDATGPVTSSEVKRLVSAACKLNVGQLIIYFSGHGWNLHQNEYWLLSGAPDDATEAVNLAASIDFATYCGVPHVAFFSDACRTAADTIQAQGVSGAPIFPNPSQYDRDSFVDVFYATRLGNPSAEIKDVARAATMFEAVYTSALVDALDGSRPELVVSEVDGGAPVGHVRCWELSDYLEAEVPKLVFEKTNSWEMTQVPKARINSRNAWLSQLAPPAGAASRGAGPPGPPPAPAAPPPPAPRGGPSTLQSVASDTLLDALRTTPLAAAAAPRPAARGADDLAAGTARVAAAGALGHFESQCGIRAFGIPIREVLAAHATPHQFDGGAVRIDNLSGPATNALVVFDDGRSALIPALAGFVAGITYDDGEIRNVAYEPSDNTWRWADMQGQLDELRALRAIIASASRLGVFRLSREDTGRLVNRMRAAKGVDPTMAIYAAYALHDIQDDATIADIQRYIRDDLQVRFYDLAMLAELPGKHIDVMPPDVFPAVPLLSQGWALCQSRGLAVPKALKGLDRHLATSLWTLFEPVAADRLRGAIASGVLP